MLIAHFTSAPAVLIHFGESLSRYQADPISVNVETIKSVYFIPKNSAGNDEKSDILYSRVPYNS